MTKKVKKVAKTKSFSIWQREIIINGKKDYFEYASLNEAEMSVMIAPLSKRKEIIFVKKYCPAENTFELVLPGGKIKKGHTPKKTAIRELMEETGYRAKKFISIETPLKILPAYFIGKTHAYLAKNLDKNKEFTKDESENLKIVKIPIKKALNLIKKGNIRDARTVAIILYLIIFSPNLLD